MSDLSEIIILLATLSTGIFIGAWLGWIERDRRAQKFEAELGDALLKHYENCQYLQPILKRIK